MPNLATVTARLRSGWIDAWKRFWFDAIDPRPLGIFRASFCLLLAYFYLARQLDYAFLFSDDGWLPYSVLDANAPNGGILPIPWRILLQDASVGSFLHAVLLLGLVGLGLGWIGRRWAWIVFVLHLAFLDRNPLVFYGSDMVATFWLGYLCLTRANSAFVWTPWKRKDATPKPPLADDPLTTIGVRLIQIQLCIIYAYSGLEKARGDSWWQGAALWQTLANGQLVTLDFGFLARFPSAIAAVTIATMLWEVYFPFLVWNRALRRYCLAFGVLLHAGIGLIVHLPFFAAFMIAPYLLFLAPQTFWPAANPDAQAH